MAYLPAGIVEVAIHGELTNGRPVYNILAGQYNAPGPANWAQVCLEAFQDRILAKLSNDYTIIEATWRSDDDFTGTAVPDPLKNLTGQDVDDNCPPNTSLLVRKVITGVVGARGGRMYLCPIPENDVIDQGTMTPAAVALWQIQLNEFYTDVTSTGNVVVVHRDPDTGDATGFSDVQDFIVDAKMATQRRRLRK